MSKMGAFPKLPDWVTEQSVRYLAHIEAGRSIRDLARLENCHPSTILRQIRRVETRRDDLLVDEALQSLGRVFVKTAREAQSASHSAVQKGAWEMMGMDGVQFDETEKLPSDSELARDALRVLRRLCENGAVLALASDMDKAVVVRDGPGGVTARTAVVGRAVARAMALNEWITCQSKGRIARYAITAAGRSALNRLMAEQESRRIATGFGDAQAPFTGALDATRPVAARTGRYVAAESPLVALSRRKDRNGKAFLSDALVAAGERLREDFELAQIGSPSAGSWERLLTGGVRSGSGSGLPALGTSAAQDRVLAALHDLGPGLSDVALRCCCFLEGLEKAEKKMGWSARSGKIVLRIALQRLRRHYDGLSEHHQMIG